MAHEGARWTEIGNSVQRGCGDIGNLGSPGRECRTGERDPAWRDLPPAATQNYRWALTLTNVCHSVALFARTNLETIQSFKRNDVIFGSNRGGVYQ